MRALPQGQDQVRLREWPRPVQKLRKGHARVLSALRVHGPSSWPESCATHERTSPSAREPSGLRRRHHARRSSARGHLGCCPAQPDEFRKVSRTRFFISLPSRRPRQPELSRVSPPPPASRGAPDLITAASNLRPSLHHFSSLATHNFPWWLRPPPLTRSCRLRMAGRRQQLQPYTTTVAQQAMAQRSRKQTTRSVWAQSPTPSRHLSVRLAQEHGLPSPSSAASRRCSVACTRVRVVSLYPLAPASVPSRSVPSPLSSPSLASLPPTSGHRHLPSLDGRTACHRPVRGRRYL
jgi:hypothetical protein